MHRYHHLLKEIIHSAYSSIELMHAEELEYKEKPGSWSKKEILGHLIDSGYNNHQRFMRAGTQNEYIFQGYDQDHWVLKNNYQKRTKTDILLTWKIVNEHLGHLISSLSEEVLTKKVNVHNFHKICMNPISQEEPVTLDYLIRDYYFI